ncbi:hypothetical protein MNBD_DELTA01-1115 [hydrothermal vent metagenome]|uniref:Uncharacterized protein n=1 Tax=hydrothermal vent metagenome TaxID=652676 RepID=A0A3B0QYC0_9ZZZZ
MKFSRKTKTIFFIVLGIIVILDFIAPRAHPVFPWDTIPAFWGAFAFVGCLLLIGVSKFLGYKCKVMKKEDFYD